jgi:hypothetical protein
MGKRPVRAIYRPILTAIESYGCRVPPPRGKDLRFPKIGFHSPSSTLDCEADKLKHDNIRLTPIRVQLQTNVLQRHRNNCCNFSSVDSSTPRIGLTRPLMAIWVFNVFLDDLITVLIRPDDKDAARRSVRDEIL